MTVYSAGADAPPVRQMYEPVAVVGSPIAGEVAGAVSVQGDSPTAATRIETVSERPDALTIRLVVPPLRSALTSPTSSTLTSVGSATVNAGTKSVTLFANSSFSSDVIRAVSPTSQSLIAAGVEMIVASGPGFAVIDAMTRVATPLAAAVICTGPVFVPSVIAVPAIPE